MSTTGLPITEGLGTASVATELVGGNSFQQIEVVGQGGASTLGVNSDGTINARIIGSVVTAGGTFTGSVSGTVGASIIGTVPVTQTTNPWIITGSVQGSFSPAANQSVSGTVGASIIGVVPVTIVSGGTGGGSVSGTIGASIIGTAPVTQASTWIASVFGTVSVVGTVPVTQSTTPWVITGSVQGSFTSPANQSVSGTVGASIIGSVPVTFTPIGNQSVSGTVGASIIGQLPSGNAIIGAVAASISGTVATTLTGNPSISGTVNVAGLQGASISGTVAVTEQGSWTASVVGGPITLYAPPSSFVSGAPSVITGTSSVVLLPTAAGGQRNYVTQVLVTNAAASGTVVSLIDAGQVVYSGYAAASGGGFSISFPFPLRQTSLAGSLGVQAGAVASVYVSASGYTAP